MLSTTLKRAAATVGVLAGLLAAAAPASAQLPPSASGVRASGWPDVPLQDSAFCVGDGVAAKCTNWAAIDDDGITQATQAGSEHGLIAYNGHAGLGGNGLASSPPVGFSKGLGGVMPVGAIVSA